MKRARLLGAALLSAVAAGAFAYIPPATGILGRHAKYRDNLHIHSLLVRGAYTFFGEEAKRVAESMKAVNAGGETTLPAEIAIKMPGRCAITLSAPSGIASEAAVTSNAQGKLKAVGPKLAVLERHAALACPLLFQKTSQAGDADQMLAQFLQTLGVDTSVVSLVRFSGAVAYAIGAKPRDLAKPQLWLNKETLYPMRLLAKVDAAAVDVRLLDYSSPASGEWHPRQVEIHEGGTLAGRFVAEKVDVNVKIADAIF